MPLGVLGLSRGRPFSPLSRAISARCSSITRCSAVMSPSKRMTSTFSSAGDRSSRFPGGDMPRQNLKSPYAESPDLPIFTRAVSPCPLQLSQAKSPLPGLLPLLPDGFSNPLKNNVNRGTGCVQIPCGENALPQPERAPAHPPYPFSLYLFLYPVQYVHYVLQTLRERVTLIMNRVEQGDEPCGRPLAGKQAGTMPAVTRTAKAKSPDSAGLVRLFADRKSV